MKIKDFAGILAVDAERAGSLAVTGLTADSRKVEQGFLFFALSGSKADGAAYAADAQRRGAAAIVVAAGTKLASATVPVIEAGDPRHALAMSAARFYGAQPATMIAVTGTAGKTSVASFVRQIWESEGKAAASIGTTGLVAPGRNEYGALTTPDPVALHRLLRELADSGVTHASMEASSHGLDQRRLDGVRLAAAAFTNLGRDHMDYHPTVEDYLRAKLRLFDTLMPKGAPAVIFADDEWSERAIASAKAAGLDVRTVGRKGSFLTIKRVEHERHRQRAEIDHDGTLHEIDLPLAGCWRLTLTWGPGADQTDTMDLQYVAPTK